MPQKYRPIIGLLALALLLRGVAFFYVSQNPAKSLNIDSATYSNISENLIAGNGYSRCAEAPFVQDTFRTPVYPCFMAIIFGLGGSWLAVCFFQILLDLGTCLLVYLCARQILGKKGGLWAGIFYATAMVSVAYTVQIATEAVFTFLFVAIFYFILQYKKKQQKRQLWIIGCLWGIATLCRPISLYIFPMLMLVPLLYPMGKQYLTRAFIPVLAGVLFLLPWVLRNQNILGQPTVSAVSGYNLLTYNAALLYAEQNNILQSEAKLKLEEEAGGLALEDRHCDRDKIFMTAYKKRGVSILKKNPLRYLFLHLKANINSLLPATSEIAALVGITSKGKDTLSILNKYGVWEAVKHYFDNRPGLIYLVPWVLWWGFFLGWSFVGIIRVLLQKQWEMLFWLLPIAYFFMVPGPAAVPRFAHPMVPFLALFAAYGMSCCYNYFRKRSKVSK